MPQQALFLLNSPFVQEQAKALAARPEVAAAKTPDAKVTALYRVALGRSPTTDELALGRGVRGATDDGRRRRSAAWAQLAQVLLLSNEFAFVD